jgi:hypothetical protein
MKDSKGNDLEVGDYIVDKFGDLSRIRHFNTNHRGDHAAAVPMLNTSGEGTASDDLWHILLYDVVKVDEEKAVFYIIRGKIEYNV